MRFGTDGVRGVANAALTGEFAMALGRATARVLGGSTFLIGRDGTILSIDPRQNLEQELLKVL